MLRAAAGDGGVHHQTGNELGFLSSCRSSRVVGRLAHSPRDVPTRLVFQHSWSSRKWSQSIEGQVSVIFYYDMVLWSFFLFIAFYTLPGYKIIKIKINENKNEKKKQQKKTFQSHAYIVKHSTSWPSIGWLHAGASLGGRTSALPL